MSGPKPSEGPLPDDQTVMMFAALTFILLLARGFGECAKRFGQPMVMGEILAGVILGKTVLGNVWPEAFLYLFGPGKKATTALKGISSFAVTMFLLIAGLEMNLKQVWERKSQAFWVETFGVILSFTLGFGAAYGLPAQMGYMPGGGVREVSVEVFAFFCGTALCITALPVVAKTLRDLHLYRTPMGMIVMAAATVSDLIGWTLFAIVLSLSGTQAQHGLGVGGTVGLSIVYTVLMLTVVRVVSHHVLPFLQAYLSWPGGVIGYVVVVCLASATFSSWVGLHSTLGAFLAGTAVGDSPHLRPYTREVIDLFVTYVFAPLFFGYIAISADFVADFDIVTVTLVLVISCCGKFIGCYFGARVTKMNVTDSLSIAVSMNARGGMEIILATVALQNFVIGTKTFVALVIMAIVTSIIPGPALRRVLKRKAKPSFATFIPQDGYFPFTSANTKEEIVSFLCSHVGRSDIVSTILAQEASEPSGHADHVATPYCVLSSITKPVILLAISQNGIDFSSPDECKANFIFLILMPSAYGKTTLRDILAEITETFHRKEFRNEVKFLQSRVEFFAAMAIEKHMLKAEQNRIVDTVLPANDPRNPMQHERRNSLLRSPNLTHHSGGKAAGAAEEEKNTFLPKMDLDLENGDMLTQEFPVNRESDSPPPTSPAGAAVAGVLHSEEASNHVRNTPGSAARRLNTNSQASLEVAQV